jgi:hypothetical protein
MTKKLEELLNLPESQDIIKADKEKADSKEKAVVEQKEDFREIAELADKELNEVADKAMTAYDDLMDLGMNVESRYSGRVFEVAGQMLKTNLDAKTVKLQNKLKMVELQLKKEKQDKEGGIDGESLVNGEGYVVTDRNSLLDKLKNMDK